MSEVATQAAITFEPTTDYGLVRSIFTDPSIYPHITDDFSPSIEDFEVSRDMRILYVLAKLNGKVIGLWMLVPHSMVIAEVHTMLFSHVPGPMKLKAAKAGIAWAWENTTFTRLVTEVPDSNQPARWFALQAGMETYGLNPQCFQKNGKLWNIHLLGISKP